MQIRRAKEEDIARINELLFEVANIHAEGRPDLFKPASKKYSDAELLQMIRNDRTPIFVAVKESRVEGYAFCICQTTENSLLLQDKKTLYVDDICVDERRRGEHIGRALYERVEAFAKEQGFDNITLNVWAFNTRAYSFYEKLGMQPQKIVMEKVLR